MSASREDQLTYLFGHATSESERLNFQQELFNALFPGREYVHSTEYDVSRAHRVLDTATGTGVWLERLARDGQGGKRLPANVQLEGSDIVLDKVTAKDTPIDFSVHDVLQPFPQEQHGKYDLVQMRYVIMAMNSEQYATAIRNLYALLKPGGTLQVVELDPRPPAPRNETEHFIKDMFDGLWSRANKDPPGICRDMQAHLCTAGFSSVDVQTSPWPWGRVAQEMGLSEEVMLKSVANTTFAFKALKGPILFFADKAPVAGVTSEAIFDQKAEDIKRFYLEIGFSSD
ncbi:2-PHYTYL-1,4-BETA-NAPHTHOQUINONE METHYLTRANSFERASE, CHLOROPLASTIC, partial [Ceraceosorus bombacis]